MTLLAAAVLLDEVARKAPKGGEGVKAGPIGLAVILALCVACYFLFKSMSRHLRKVREQYPVRGRDPGDAAAPPARSDDSADSAVPTTVPPDGQRPDSETRPPG